LQHKVGKDKTKEDYVDVTEEDGILKWESWADSICTFEYDEPKDDLDYEDIMFEVGDECDLKGFNGLEVDRDDDGNVLGIYGPNY